MAEFGFKFQQCPTVLITSGFFFLLLIVHLHLFLLLFIFAF